MFPLGYPFSELLRETERTPPIMRGSLEIKATSQKPAPRFKNRQVLRYPTYQKSPHSFSFAGEAGQTAGSYAFFGLPWLKFPRLDSRELDRCVTCGKRNRNTKTNETGRPNPGKLAPFALGHWPSSLVQLDKGIEPETNTAQSRPVLFGGMTSQSDLLLSTRCGPLFSKIASFLPGPRRRLTKVLSTKQHGTWKPWSHPTGSRVSHRKGSIAPRKLGAVKTSHHGSVCLNEGPKFMGGFPFDSLLTRILCCILKGSKQVIPT